MTRKRLIYSYLVANVSAVTLQEGASVKRTRELTSIHYRRTVTKPSSSDVQSQSHTRCPICGAPLEAVFVSDPGGMGGPQAVPRIAFPVAQQVGEPNHAGVGDQHDPPSSGLSLLQKVRRHVLKFSK